MKYTTSVERVVTDKVELEINPGEVWINDLGYRLKILDCGKCEIWCEWENGNRGTFDLDKFAAAHYQKQPPAPEASNAD